MGGKAHKVFEREVTLSYLYYPPPSYIVELPLRVNDQQNRFLEKAFELGRTLYNATLGTALGCLQRMRETQEWRVARDMPKGKARTKAFSAVH